MNFCYGHWVNTLQVMYITNIGMLGLTIQRFKVLTKHVKKNTIQHYVCCTERIEHDEDWIKYFKRGGRNSWLESVTCSNIFDRDWKSSTDTCHESAITKVRRHDWQLNVTLDIHSVTTDVHNNNNLHDISLCSVWHRNAEHNNWRNGNSNNSYHSIANKALLCGVDAI
jgi:hypothetical protein